MTTLAELCLQPPDPTHGKPLQFEYGVGDMMLAFEIADISAGAGIVWHDLSEFFERARWRVGAEAPYGKYRDGNPVVVLRRRLTDSVNDFDALAPWYEDTSAVFGSHVRLRGGLIARLGILRVADGVTDKWFPLFTSRVKRWSDGARAMGNNRYHQLTCMGMQSRLSRKPLSSRLPEGWRPRLDADLTEAAWNLPVEVYGAETEDDGGGAVPTVKLAARPALTSAAEALNATLDPVGLVWRITPTGTLLVEPAPWTTFHDDKFADAGLTVTGALRVNPLLGLYPGGRVTFSWSPADEPGQVGFYNYPTDGDGFGIDSDVENVVNEWQITYPVDVDDEGAGTASRNYQDPVSADQFDPLPMQAATWLARNDQVQDDTVDFRAYADLVTPPLHTSIDAPGAFPALAVLGQYDPITVVNATREDRTQVTANGIIRSITHEMAAGKLGTGVTWKAWVQPDLQSSEQTPLLKPVNALQATDVREDGATFSWSEPTQTVAPTETQVRMNSGPWLSIAYPAGGFDWFTGLAPKTLHKFEVRLVRKVDELTTHVSPVREVSFTTLEVTVPTVPPDGDGTVVVVPPPDEECDVVWELLRSSDGITYTMVASGDKDDFVYDEETDTWTLDNSSYTFEEGYTYRRRVREICGGVPGDWVYETPTSIVCEDPAQLGSAPYDDATLKVFVPKICGTKVLEAVTGVEGTKGPAFGGIGLDNAGNYALKSATGVGGIVAYGAAGIEELTGDLSKAITINLGTVPASGSPVALWQCAGLHIEAHYVSASTWRVRAKIFLASGGSITTTFSGALNLDTEYEIFVEHDVENETVSVKVDDTEVGTGTAGARVNALPVWIMALPADSYATSAAVWATSIDPGAGWTPADIDGISLKAWYDASDAATITESGGLVSAWADKSSNGLDLSGSGATRPTTGAATLNSLNVLRFNGDWLDAASAADWKFLHVDLEEYAIGAVVKFGTVANPATAYVLLSTHTGAGLGDSTDAGCSLFYDDRTGKNDTMYHYVRSLTNVNVSWATPNDNMPAQTWRRFTLRAKPYSTVSGGDRSIFNFAGGGNVAGNPITAGPGTSNPKAPLRIGAMTNGTLPAVMDLAELVISDDRDDQAEIDAYLAAKWGV